MPSYYVRSGNGVMVGCCPEKTVDRCSAVFFNNLATKLLAMSESIQKRIEDLESRPCNQVSRGFLFASIETPKMALGVKYEYVEYIKRYGPPIKGKFDEDKLNIIREELGIENNVI